MALRDCNERGKPVSTNAHACVGCGAPTPRRGSRLKRMTGYAAAGMILVSIVAARTVHGPRSASARQTGPLATPGGTPKPGREQQKAYDASADQTYPFKMVTMLERQGLKDDGEGWHKSKFDGVWNATLHASFGANEVSCLLESSVMSTIQRAELEAEFHKPGTYEGEILLLFAKTAPALMYPDKAPAELGEAIAAQREWSNERWEFVKVLYDNGGYGLILRRKSS